jgi:hypothetical protein
MKRYFVVLGPRHSIAHRATTHIDGNATACGVRMRAGWKWFLGFASAPRQLGARRCHRCYR